MKGAVATTGVRDAVGAGKGATGAVDDELSNEVRRPTEFGSDGRRALLFLHDNNISMGV